MGNKIGDFFKGDPEEIKKRMNEERRKKELSALGYNEKGELVDESKLDYDPINKKKYNPGKEAYLIEDAEIYSDEKIEEYIDLIGDNYNKLQEKLDYNEENREHLGLESLVVEKHPEAPEYSQEEEAFLSKASKEWLYLNKITFEDGSEITRKDNPEYEARVIEMLKEFKDLFPEDYIKAINRKIITKDLGSFNWEEESFKDKKTMVSYFPNKEEAQIKYINHDHRFKNLDQVFINKSVNKEGKVIKDRNGTVLVFCEAPSWYKKQKKKTKA